MAQLGVERVGFCPPGFFRYLYAEVGRAYRWTDRAAWSDGRFARTSTRVNVIFTSSTSRVHRRATSELRRHADQSIEVPTSA